MGRANEELVVRKSPKMRKPIFALRGYIKMEMLKVEAGTNHFR